MDKSEWLAINVLGWTLDDIACPPVYLKENGSTCIASSFQPDKHIIHAMMLLDKVDSWSIDYNGQQNAFYDGDEIYFVNINDDDSSDGHDSLNTSITEGILKWSGYYA